ncbi:PDDEXK nuclease domain-containing protein [Aquisphaera insulae]|uniref:PDDEXK nuclease domain-containing protein n=1 Tax=Aquisphaera insulae TaxID=2712864 RepID=UPI0013ECCC59|nr:PDDEXK nuclease domain-containing protein [Aquisphaera insulae]
MGRKKPSKLEPVVAPSGPSGLPEGYDQLLVSLKDRIRAAQLRAAVAVNRELVLLYWGIGRDILTRQEDQGWGAKVIDRLAEDLKRAFPEMSGFSPRNLKYMRAFAEAWPEEPIVQQLVAQIPWGHNVRLLDHVKDPDERVWYIRKTIENGWSRNILEIQIETDLYRHQGKALNNFAATLPKPQSDLAEQILKDPYNFDFLTLGDAAREREIERGLMEHIRQFLLELGVGFAFVGSQHRLEVGGEEFFIDLLFYHLKLRAYVVIELKATEFRPEHAGKMNFYLSAVDDLLRHPQDAPTIGIILCKSKGKIVAEYALRDINKPIGISGFTLSESLPETLRGSLPTIADLEAELSNAASEDEGTDTIRALPAPASPSTEPAKPKASVRSGALTKGSRKRGSVRRG